MKRRLAHVLSFTAYLVIACAARAAAASGEIAAGRDVVTLNGTWEILFDDDNQGRDAGWNLNRNFSRQASIRRIQVPSCWELTEKDYEGVAFYRRRFKVPAGWKGKVVRLHFDAVNSRSEVWINDHFAGAHEGGFTPFELRIDGWLDFAAENTLIVCVVGPILLQDKRVDGMGPMADSIRNARVHHPPQEVLSERQAHPGRRDGRADRGLDGD